MIACLLVVAVGCGGSSDGFTPVQGTITFAGSPVIRGSIAFHPVGGGRPARGKIRPEGKYQLSTKEKGDGALPGEYLVEIRSVEIEVRGDAARGRTTWLVPERYASPETSGLKATVNGDSIDFDLPAE